MNMSNCGIRRRVFNPLLFCLGSCLTTACARNFRQTESDDPLARFKGVCLVYVVDAVIGESMRGVTIVDDRSKLLYSQARVARKSRGYLVVGPRRVPLSVRVIWRDGPRAIWGRSGQIEWEGPILGDYSIEVASRIPQEVLASIRSKPGDLRLKFRLKPDGVMLGWDIERDPRTGTRYDMVGGDFLETFY